MSDKSDKNAFIEVLRPLAQRLEGIAIDDVDAALELLRIGLPFDGDTVAAVRRAAVEGMENGWLLPHENGGIRYGRAAKDLCGFSVDAVLMDGPGPKHRHPNGEVDLCFALDGEPEFDGHGEGWVVYPPDSVHVPTVGGGQMLILYFLPGAAIEFL